MLRLLTYGAVCDCEKLQFRCTRWWSEYNWYYQVHVDLVESEQAVDRCILLCRLQIFGSKSFCQRHSYVGNVAYIADSIVLRALHFVLAMHCRFLTVVSAKVFLPLAGHASFCCRSCRLVVLSCSLPCSYILKCDKMIELTGLFSFKNRWANVLVCVPFLRSRI